MADYFIRTDSIINTLWPIGVILLAVLAGRSDWFSQRLILSDIRHARKQLAYGRDEQDQEKLSRVSSDIENYMWDLVRDIDRRPADLLAKFASLDHLAAPATTAAQTSEPYTKFAYLIGQMLLTPGHQRLLNRVIYSAMTTKIREEAARIVALIDRDHLGTRALIVEDRKFADWVSLFTGSYVLADGTASRAGVIGRVVVHHADHWHSTKNIRPSRIHPPLIGVQPGDDAAPENGASAYTGLHTNVETTSLLTHEDSDAPLAEFDDKHQFKPGDYDGRIMSLRTIRHRQHIESGEYVVELGTVETCYTITERHPKYKCKHLTTRAAGTPSPVCMADDATHSTVISAVETTLLNTIVAIVARSDKDDCPVLLLARRSNNSRNANNVDSVPGGVFEHRRGQDLADCDDFGVPDPLLSALRETQEELGIDIPQDRVAAVAVLLANIQGRPNPDQVTATDRDNGQLVATVCHLAMLDMTADEVRRRHRQDSNWRKGRFEIHSLVDLPVPQPSPDEDGNLQPSAIDDSCKEYCQEILNRSQSLDQNAIVSALYTGAHFYGVKRMMALTTAAFEGSESGNSPWWQIPWADDPLKAHRLVVSPRDLFGENFDTIAQANAHWRAAVDDAFPRHDYRHAPLITDKAR